MFEFFKRLVVFAIGLWIILYIAQIVLGTFSFTGAARDITGALKELSALGHRNASTTGSVMGPYGTNSTSGSQSVPKTSSGAENAVSFINFSRGAMVSTSTAILGNIQDSWLFDSQTAVRFTDENGTVLATSQLVADQSQTFGGMSPFTLLPTVSKTGGTGYMLIEKANTTGLSKNNAQYVIPITYPIGTTSTNQTNTTNTFSSSSSSGNGLMFGTTFTR